MSGMMGDFSDLSEFHDKNAYFLIAGSDEDAEFALKHKKKIVAEVLAAYVNLPVRRKAIVLVGEGIESGFIVVAWEFGQIGTVRINDRKDDA